MVGTEGDYVVQNEIVWFYGADNGSTGYEVILQQRRRRKTSNIADPTPEFHTLFKIEPGGDATAIGMLVAELDMGGGLAGARVHHTVRDPRPEKENDA